VIQVISLLYAGEGGREALKAHERRVMPILHDYGGRLISASHPSEPRDGDPDEIHIVHFDDMTALGAFRGDPRHAAMKAERLRAIRDVRLFITDQFVTYID
jgi:uncharacterized protein (DUF1330 family)